MTIFDCTPGKTHASTMLFIATQSKSITIIFLNEIKMTNQQDLHIPVYVTKLYKQ